MARNALGRGLGALIRDPDPQPAPNATASVTGAATATAPARSPAGPQLVDIDLIEPSPFQPRTRFREESLAELARSIQSSGIVQPLVVRPLGARFQLLAGEGGGGGGRGAGGGGGGGGGGRGGRCLFFVFAGWIQWRGIVQPLVVRPLGARFQLLAGERRWRAAQRA